MAGDWMKIELELPDKPEVHFIANTLDIDPDAVVGKLVRVWSWFDKHTETGNAVGVSFALVNRLTGVSGFAEAMARVDWLQSHGDTLTLPRFDRHNGKTAKNRALTAKRVKQHQEKTNAKTNAPSVSKALTREEKRRDINTPPVPPPDCSQVIHNLNAGAWERWLAYRRKVRLKPYKTDTQAKALAKYPPDVQAQAVDESIRQQWQGLFPEKIQRLQKADALPRNDHELPDFARARNLPAPRAGETYPQYRARLTAEMEKTA